MKPNEKPQACCVQTMFCSSKKTKIRLHELVDRLNVLDKHFTCYLSYNRVKSLVLCFCLMWLLKAHVNRSKRMHCTNEIIFPLVGLKSAFLLI